MVAVHVDALEHVWICVQTTVGQLGDVPIVPNKRVQTTIAATVHHTLRIENCGVAGTAIVCTGSKIPRETRTLFAHDTEFRKIVQHDRLKEFVTDQVRGEVKDVYDHL